ncbi:MAG TPA: ion transporter [Candidatus Sulfotelmatobacter sp.]|nr:ion transporter [Candidatus Sulfotelmatobacter sp.]
MEAPHSLTPSRAPWRDRWNEIIFGHETIAGRLFDLILLVVILLSVLTVLLESVRSIREAHGQLLEIAEWVFTILFTIEYVARLATAKDATRYARSFFGIVDFLAIGPIYLSLFFGVTHSFAVFRSLRLLRVFRVLKLTQFIGEAAALRIAVAASMRKIIVFLFAVITIVVIVGALMYQIEGEQNGFTSIPAAMYWAVVTVTTVGYGDISPHTVLGRLLASVLMILGYGIIAVPTGIVSFELARATGSSATRACTSCSLAYHDRDASYCKQCGSLLPRP